MSVEVKEVVEVVHIEGCHRNKGCGAECRRIKVKGEWEAHITVRPPGGQPVRRRLRIPAEFSKTATERRSWGERQEELVKESLSSSAQENYTVSQLVEEWIRERKADGVESIVDDEPCLLRHALPLLGALRLGDLRRRHAVDFISQLKRTPSSKGGTLAACTVQRAYFTLHSVFEYAVLKEYVTANPVSVPRGVLPKAEDKDPTWRDEAIFGAAEVAQLVFDERIPKHRRVRYAVELLAVSVLARLRLSGGETTTRPSSRSGDSRHPRRTTPGGRR